MTHPHRPDSKLEALREQGLLNPKPERVTDEVFRASEFFDARDLLQVKYEMIRRVEVDGASIASVADAFGFSRPSVYQTQAALAAGGLPALLPKKRGPRGAHKLSSEIMEFIEEVRAGDATITAATFVDLLKKRFGVTVHRRSIERALARREKKRR